ncbi:MAG: hypothetical protein HZY75_14000 [Nocardioidaceae bacterium]|nr:MAG: hypothetical protein HZY75_14000 [Nocardioidaceae bacterium]
MILEHGIGGAKDLPIPSQFAIAGASAALAVSFIVLAIAWRTPRFDAATQGRPVPRLARVVDSAWFAWAARLLGLAFAGYVGWAAVAGPDKILNPFLGVVYVWLWVGLVPASLLFGSFYKAINPVRTLHLLMTRATGTDPSQGVLRLPARVGLWPGALGLFAFVWMELVYERSSYVVDLRLWFLLYIAIVFIGAVIFGDRWIAAADPFEVYSTLVGRLSFFGRTADQTLVVRSPLRNLDGTSPAAGLTAVIAVLFGSTAFDSFRDSPTWTKVLQGEGLAGISLDLSRQTLNLLGLLFFVIVVFASFCLATMFTGVEPGTRRRRLPDQFAHAVIPIIVGYVVAHYLSYFVVMSQTTLIQLSDPMIRGDNLLGTANLTINQEILMHPTMLAFIKVASVITGHVLGVIASHDRAIKLLPRRHQLTGQLPLLAVMVFYTTAGLYLLLNA